MRSNSSRRQRLRAWLATGASLEEALSRAGSERAARLSRAGAPLEEVMESDPGLFGGGLRAVIVTGERCGDLPAAARAHRRFRGRPDRVLKRIGVLWLYPAFLGLLLFACALQLPELPGPEFAARPPLAPAGTTWVLGGAAAAALVAALYWLLYWRRRSLLLHVAWVGRVYRRATETATVGAAAGLVRAGCDADSALAAAAELVESRASSFASAPRTAEAMERFSACGELQVDAAIDKLYAAVRLFGIALIGALIVLYALGGRG